MMSTSEVNSCRPRVERDIAVLKHSDAYIALWKYLLFQIMTELKFPFQIIEITKLWKLIVGPFRCFAYSSRQ